MKKLHAGDSIADSGQVEHHTHENQSETARLPGINRLTLRKKLGLWK